MAKKAYVGVENFTPRDLPSGYTQLEYIQSSGTQYIDTGYKPNGNTCYEVKYHFSTDTNSNIAVIGADAAWKSNDVSLWTRHAAFYDSSIGSQTSWIKNSPVTMKFDKGVLYQNNVLLWTATPSATTFQCDYNAYLFAINRSGTAIELINGLKLYYAKIWDDDTLVRDFVPCKNASGTIGLYDMVNGVFYQNAGSGTFTAGSTERKDVAQTVKKVYIGINGVAREVTKAYIGDENGKARLWRKPTEIYGVLWDGTSTSKFSRTDAAANFADPVPYVSGASSYGSPFDDIYPWTGMKEVTDPTAGTLVSIPKFYYKWTKSGATMKLQISEAAFTGSYVSPAHADRGDGKGERDVVYVGRYHCNSSYKSVTGSSPVTSITRATARSGISNLGSAYWQWDYAMLTTIQMLYLVEFADWNSQETIGYGCGNNSAKQNVGASDSMPYHTGTMQLSRTTTGVGCQYRYIEDLWGNVFDWCDGIYASDLKFYCIKNPANFSDSSGGTYIGPELETYNEGVISSYGIPTADGFNYAIYPTSISRYVSPYISDKYYYSSIYGNLSVGGCCYPYDKYGLFYFDLSLTSSKVSGTRLQKLP